MTHRVPSLIVLMVALVLMQGAVLVVGWEINNSRIRSVQKQVKRDRARALTAIYVGNVKACDNENALRVESNHRLKSHVVDRDVLERFMQAAIHKNRLVGDSASLAGARAYSSGLDRERRLVVFHRVPLVRCRPPHGVVPVPPGVDPRSAPPAPKLGSN